jgi:hypothetical protein
MAAFSLGAIAITARETDSVLKSRMKGFEDEDDL